MLPLFLTDGKNVSEPIAAMPGRARLSIDRAIRECENALSLGVRAFDLFQATDPSLKTPDAKEALNPENLTCRAVHAIKTALPEACLITDIALDPYSSLGHDGLISDDGVVLNDETVEGLECEDLRAFSIQYHAEASPGPLDSRGLFKQFLDRIREPHRWAEIEPEVR